jgi:hypothetical protein
MYVKKVEDKRQDEVKRRLNCYAILDEWFQIPPFLHNSFWNAGRENHIAIVITVPLISGEDGLMVSNCVNRPK